MPKIEPWSRLPQAVRQHLIERFADRNIAALDIEQLRAWLATSPDVPEGPWFKDFGSFKICGEGQYPKTFLLRGQVARGTEL